MNIIDLVEEGRLYDALLLTVGLIEKSEHEEMEINALIKSYRLCSRTDADSYLLDMIKIGILKVLCNSNAKK